MLTITVVSPSEASVGSAPGGLGYLAEMYQAADLADGLSQEQLPDRWLFQSLAKLRRRFPGRLRIRWVSPYSLPGLMLTIRLRIRSYPTIIVGGEVLEAIEESRDFEEIVIAHLAGTRA